MSADKWVWMPHPAHFILSHRCRFFLSTHVNGFIVSTVGQCVHPRDQQERIAREKGVVLVGHGDDREDDFLRKVGFMPLSHGEPYTFETMVFVGKKAGGCCAYEVADHSELFYEGYTSAADAVMAHYIACERADSGYWKKPAEVKT